MNTLVLVPCANCGDLVDADLPDDGSEAEVLLLADTYCVPCIDLTTEIKRATAS